MCEKLTLCKRTLNSSTIDSGLEIDRFHLKDTLLPISTQQIIEKHYVNKRNENGMKELRRKEKFCTAQIQVSSKSKEFMRQ